MVLRDAWGRILRREFPWRKIKAQPGRAYINSKWSLTDTSMLQP